MFKFTYSKIDNEDGNPPEFYQHLLKTDDPYIALAITMRLLQWSEHNIKACFTEDPSFDKLEVVNDLMHGEETCVPAVESTEEERWYPDYKMPHWSYEDIFLKKVDRVPITIELGENENTDTILLRVQKAKRAVDRDMEEPNKSDIVTSKKIAKLLGVNPVPKIEVKQSPEL